MYILGLCDRSSMLYVFLVIKIFINIICVIVPIIFLYRAIVPFFNVTVKGKEIKGELVQLLKSFVASLIIFLIPGLLNYFFTSVLNEDITEVSTCYTNATMSKIEELRKKEEEEREKQKQQEKEEKERLEKELREKEEKDGKINRAKAEEWLEKYGSSHGGTAHSISNKSDYDNRTLNVEKAVNTNINNPNSGLGDGRNRYRAVQAAAYTGKYVVYAQNKNYGSIESSSKGGRICWSDLQTGEQVKCVEVGSEGGHMDGLAYDNDRGYVLKTASGGKLMLFDNSTMSFKGYSNIPSIHTGITYVPSIQSVVGEEDGKLIFYKFNDSNNTYERYKTINLQNYQADSVQGIGTDGTNIFIADSSPYNSIRKLYTYSLEGELLESHSFGGGFGDMSDEVESAFADNDGTLYLACPQGIARVMNYKANIIGLPSR